MLAQPGGHSYTERMPTMQEVKDQIKALPHKYVFYTRKEIKYLPRILTDDEEIRALTSGYLGTKTVLLVCTTRRLLFIDKGMFFGLRVKQLNLDRVQSIESSYIIVFGSIRVWDGAASYEISMILKDSIDPFVQATRQAIQDYRALVVADARRPLGGRQYAEPAAPPPPSAGSNAAQPDALEQLERLARLKEQGHITEEEFNAQKQKLLNA
jgi:hypothetical protein